MSSTRSIPVSVGEPDKVTAWPFKEPEKTSAWDNEKQAAMARMGPKDAPVSLVDYEAETLERAKKALRENVSPLGALGLPPLLDKHRVFYGIPDAAFKVQATWDRIFVYPIDPVDPEDDQGKFKGTSIHKPELTKKRDRQDGHRGVLISAGLIAADKLMSHGYELGDVVLSNKNVPFARRYEHIPGAGDIFVLIMREADLAGSETLMSEIREGRKKIIDTGGPDNYCHQVAELVDDEWVVRKKKSVYVNDTW